MIVDVHAHGLSEDFIVEAAGDPRRGWRVEIAAPRQYIAADYGPLDSLLYDVEGRLASLRSRNVALQLISPPPPLVAALGHAADVATARRLNASTAKLVADGEGLLAGLAVPGNRRTESGSQRIEGGRRKTRLRRSDASELGR